ncbi:hypothetical protein SynPROS71_02860 [Synechococcus sp. PROS-7-1]|nr:hypothetical protein SynPROS71_02860 [Synechococcus sp. PROS-7-1]
MNGCGPFQSDSSNSRIVCKLMHAFGCEGSLASNQDVPLFFWEMALKPENAMDAGRLELNEV